MAEKVIKKFFHPAGSLMSEADFETIETYKDNIAHYKERNFSYMPIPDSMKYYDTEEDELRDMDEEQFISEDEHIYDILVLLNKHPFLLHDRTRWRSIPVEGKMPMDIDKAMGTESVSIYEALNSEKVLADIDYSEDEIKSLVPDKRCEIITIADLKKREVKATIYPTLAHLESDLSNKIEGEYPESEKLVERIGDNLQDASIGRWYKSKHEGLELHIAEFMSLRDIKNTYDGLNELRSSTGISNGDVDKLHSISKLRHKVMHTNRSLLDSKDDLNKIIERIEKAEKLIHKLNK